MSTSTVETPGTTAGPTISRDRVTWRDIIAVGWRQHRSMLLGTGAIVLLGAALMTLISSLLVDHGNIDSTLPLLVNMGMAQATEALTICITGYSAVVAVFWAAPLLAKEYEQRTHLFAWGQDVSPLRWLAGKTLLLASVAVSFAVLLGALGNLMLRQYNAANTDRPELDFHMFTGGYFEAAPMVQAGYALFAFALGLVISAICRRTVLSMGLTLVGYITARVLVAEVFRPHYRTPLRESQPLGQEHFAVDPTMDHSLHVGYGYLDSAGDPVSYPEGCQFDQVPDFEAEQTCLREHGITAHYTDYQPADRISEFHIIEFGLFTALAALLFTLSWWLLRRNTRL